MYCIMEKAVFWQRRCICKMMLMNIIFETFSLSQWGNKRKCWSKKKRDIYNYYMLDRVKFQTPTVAWLVKLDTLSFCRHILALIIQKIINSTGDLHNIMLLKPVFFRPVRNTLKYIDKDTDTIVHVLHQVTLKVKGRIMAEDTAACIIH